MSFIAYIIRRWVSVRTNATSEVQTSSTSSAGADVSQPEHPQPPNKKLKLLQTLDSWAGRRTRGYQWEWWHSQCLKGDRRLSSTHSSYARIEIISPSLLETSLWSVHEIKRFGQFFSHTKRILSTCGEYVFSCWTCEEFKAFINRTTSAESSLFCSWQLREVFFQ